jgi:uncharacterized membrane protein
VDLTLLAGVELVTDQLPSSRLVPQQFGARLVLGGLCGATIGGRAGMTLIGLLFDAGGAVVGTLGGARMRAGLAASFGSDRPAALIEDAIAIVLALVVAVTWGAVR